ncbi:MAG TPA: hypothetical protein VGL11_05960 [Candidatus Binatia bacterium]
MGWRTTLLTGLAGLLLMGFASDASAAEGRRGGCRRGDRLSIQDLDVTPDPVVEGQRIRGWKVRIRLDAERECDTEIEIREGNELAGGPRRYTLRPGVNEIDMPAVERYRFSRKEHCFDVAVDLEGTRRPVDAARKFCAQQRPSWTLREPGDRGGPPPYRERF